MQAAISDTLAINLESFSVAVINWFLINGRNYPWRQTSNPFHILIAEVLLRMTGAWKVERPYYVLVSKYASPKDMVGADITELEKLFLPLGLHHRAGLLVSISEELVKRFDGKVPGSYDDLVGVKGIGKYTANSILCLAFGQKLPLVDSSISRLFRRCFNFSTGKAAYADKKLWQLLQNILPDSGFREFNLGLLDIAAIHCKYPKPDCISCPLAKMCLAHSSMLAGG